MGGPNKLREGCILESFNSYRVEVEYVNFLSGGLEASGGEIVAVAHVRVWKAQKYLASST